MSINNHSHFLSRFNFYLLQSPASTAVVDHGQRFTYRDLKRRVDQYVYGFQKQGCEKGDLIVFYYFKDVEFLSALLAALSLGLRCMCLDISLHSCSLESILNSPDIKLILKYPEFDAGSKEHFLNLTDLRLEGEILPFDSELTGELVSLDFEPFKDFLNQGRLSVSDHHFHRTFAFSLESPQCIFDQYILPLFKGGAVVLAESILELPSLGKLSLLSSKYALLKMCLDIDILPKQLKYIMVSDADTLSKEALMFLHNGFSAKTIYNKEFSSLSFQEALSDDSNQISRWTEKKRAKSLSVEFINAKLQEMLHDQLSVDVVLPQANLFEMADHTNMPVKLAASIKQQFNINVSIRDILSSPTVNELSCLIEEAILERSLDEKLKYDPIVCLKEEGEGEPLFLIHSIDGAGHFYYPLARLLKLNRPVYLIQDPLHLANDLVFSNLSELASRVLHLIKKIQPSGCYYLIGCSYGGMLVIEVMRQLKLLSNSIGFVGLLDAWAKYTDTFKSLDRLRVNIDTQSKLICSRLKQFSYPEPEELLIHSYERLMLHVNYFPGIIDERLTLFKAKESYLEYLTMESPANGWNKYSAYPARVVMIPGNHDTMLFDPYVKSIADSINQLIAYTPKTSGHVSTVSLVGESL